MKFLKDNLTKYSELVDETIGTYELHRTYINHYQSYKTTTRHLYDKIQALDLTKPEMPRHSDATSESMIGRSETSNCRRHNSNPVIICADLAGPRLLIVSRSS